MPHATSSVVDLTYASVKAFPDQTAVRWLNEAGAVETLNFSQVWALASRAAAVLRNLWQEADLKPWRELSSESSVPRICVAIDDGVYLSISELSVLLAGAAIVPLDPHDPTARLQGLIAEVEPSAVLTKDWGDAKKVRGAVDGDIPVYDVSTDLLNIRSIPRSGEPPLDIPLNRLCYIWFTSGSTGKPKGCRISHRAFAHYCGKAKHPSHHISNDSTVLIATANTFDPSVGDIFSSWALGAAIAVAPKLRLFAQLGWVIERTAATHVCCTPSLWQMLEVAPCCNLLQTLQVLTLGGERMTRHQVQTWSTRAGVRFLNVYGTTECTVWQTVHEMTPESSPTCAGKPKPGNSIAIIENADDDLQVKSVMAGDAGEVVIGGAQVGDGYLGRPELNALRFIEAPSLGPGLWYRTGDQGRLLADGCLELIGRTDSQVKVRGIRVELGEIEESILSGAGPEVLTSATAVMRDGRLVAYCQASAGLARELEDLLSTGADNHIWEHPVLTEYLLRNTAALVPRYMLPTRFLLMQRLPLTANGKVAAAQLPEAPARAMSSSAEDGVLTSFESVVAGIWAEVLAIDPLLIRAQDHFLELGGASPDVLKVSRRLHAALKEANIAPELLEPTGPLAHSLAPERLIHTPRLAQYAQLLERAGIAAYLLKTCKQEAVATVACAKDTEATMNEDGEHLSELNGKSHNSSNHLEPEPSLGTHQIDSEPKDGDHLDHDAWEQVPKTSLDELLIKAGSAGLGAVAQALLVKKADVNGGFESQAGKARGSGVGAKPHIRHGLSPLHVAVSNSRSAVVEILLNAKANVMHRDKRGSTPLHAAAERGTAEVVLRLLGAGAQLGAIDHATRSTAIHIASKRGNESTLKALLDWAAKHGGLSTVDDMDRWNRSPLHWTVIHGHAKCCKVLLDASADVEPNPMDGPNVPKKTRRAIERSYETPMEAAVRVHGESGGEFGDLLRDGLLSAGRPAKIQSSP